MARRQRQELIATGIEDQFEGGRSLDGQIGGVGARQNPAHISPRVTPNAGETRSIAHQATGHGEFTPLIDGRDGIARRKRYKLLAPAVEERIGIDDERAHSQLYKRSENSIDLAFGAGLQNVQLQSPRARPFLHVPKHRLVIWSVRVDEQGDYFGLRDQFGKQLEPFWGQRARHVAEASDAAPGPGETGNEASRYGVRDANEEYRDSRGCGFRRAHWRAATAGHDYVDLARDEVNSQRWKPILVVLRPPVLDRHVLSLDVAGFAQSPVERGNKWRKRAGRGTAEKTDHRHRLLLRAGRAWRSHRAAQQKYQLAPLHSMISSARTRIDGGTVRPSALAVLRLMTSSNLVGCWTGRSAGWAPFRIFPA